MQLAQRFVAHVVRDVAEVEAWLLDDLQAFVCLEAGEVRRTRVDRDLAFVGLELLHARGGVGHDGEDQLVDFHPARVPEFLVAPVANLRILLIALKHERPCTDRLLIDVAHVALGHQLFGVLGGENAGEVHRDVLDECRIDRIEGEDDGQRVGLLDGLDLLVQAHAGEVGELGRVSDTERMIGLEHAIEGEQHVVGVEVTAGLEVLVAVELHALAQMKRVDQAVFRGVPGSRQRWNHGGIALLEFGESIVDRLGCIVIGGGSVLSTVEASRARFGAKHQIACRLGKRGQCQQSQARRHRKSFTHDDPYPRRMSRGSNI